MIAFPQFHITVVEDAQAGTVLGTISSTEHGSEKWVDDNYLGFLLDSSHVVAGRWHARGDKWAFTPEDPATLETLRRRSHWTVLDSYWGQRAEIVLNRSLEWTRVLFEPSDVLMFKSPDGKWLWCRKAAEPDREKTPSECGDGELVKAGWDHEHCSVCWRTIGFCGDAEAYRSQPDTWVCEKCFHEYVERRSLDFVQCT